MMFEVEQKIDWSLINEDTKDKELLKSFFIDKDNESYGIVGNTDFVIVRAIISGKLTYYVQRREDYVKQQNGYFYHKRVNK
jgi:hypothetical protein